MEVLSFQGLGFGLILLGYFDVEEGDHLAEDSQNLGVEGDLGDLFYEGGQAVSAEHLYQRVGTG